MFFSEIKKLFSEIKFLYFPKTSIFERFSEIKKIFWFFFKIFSKIFSKYISKIYFKNIFKLFSEIFSKNILNFAKTSKNGCFGKMSKTKSVTTKSVASKSKSSKIEGGRTLKTSGDINLRTPPFIRTPPPLVRGGSTNKGGFLIIKIVGILIRGSKISIGKLVRDTPLARRRRRKKNWFFGGNPTSKYQKIFGKHFPKNIFKNISEKYFEKYWKYFFNFAKKLKN